MCLTKECCARSSVSVQSLNVPHAGCDITFVFYYLAPLCRILFI